MEIACGGILYIKASCFRRRVLSGPSALSEPFVGGMKTGSGGGAEEVEGLDGVLLKGLAILHLKLKFRVTIYFMTIFSYSVFQIFIFDLKGKITFLRKSMV